VIALDAATGRITGRRPGTASVIATSEGAEGASRTLIKGFWYPQLPVRCVSVSHAVVLKN
jgi:hypothetical protein